MAPLLSSQARVRGRVLSQADADMQETESKQTWAICRSSVGSVRMYKEGVIMVYQTVFQFVVWVVKFCFEKGYTLLIIP
jgi:hypothetical protein